MSRPKASARLGVARDDSDDELGTDDLPWEWILDAAGEQQPIIPFAAEDVHEVHAAGIRHLNRCNFPEENGGDEGGHERNAGGGIVRIWVRFTDLAENRPMNRILAMRLHLQLTLAI